jgi:hypothetical protein
MTATPRVDLLKGEKMLSSFLLNAFVEVATNEPLSMGFWLKAVCPAFNRKRKMQIGHFSFYSI